MNRPSANSLLLIATCCFLFLVTHARHQQPDKPAADDDSVGAGCAPHEREALLSFKRGVANDAEGLLGSWRRGHDCCRWRGVACSNQSGHVVKLELHGPGLAGQISPSLLSLEHLEHLDLRNTSLQGATGSVPEFLGSLRNLRYLDLSQVPFSGRVPPQLGNLSNLRHLDLGAMQDVYSTDISWLARLRLLEHLDMSYVNLSMVDDWPHVLNEIPSLELISLVQCSLSRANHSLTHQNLTKLTTLLLDSNYFGHPCATSWFWNLTSIRYLFLSETYLSGPFPNILGSRTSLQWLDFNYNGNTATMEVDLKDLCALEYLSIDESLSSGNITQLVNKLPQCPSNKLQYLFLSHNNITGILPERIGHLTSLLILNLSNNSITGAIPPEIENCTNLQSLHLRSNHLIGPVPTMPRRLKLLDISMNYLSGPLPLDFGARNLLELNLFSNYFTGHVPESVCYLKELIVMDLANNSLEGELPQCSPMPNMTFLLLSKNRFSGNFPTLVQSCTNLAFLDLAWNKFDGTLPLWVGGLVNLRFMQLSHNMFYGHIPFNITNLRHLRHLSLAGNNFSGAIPWYLSNLVAMAKKLPEETTDDMLSLYQIKIGTFEEVLSVVTKRQELKYGAGIFQIVGIDLSLNHLTGVIPDEITSLHELLNLNLSCNQLVGKIPDKIGAMKLVESLDLSRNNLSGEIPPSLSELTYLGYLDLSYNNLTGSIPPGRQLDTLFQQNPSIYDGNSALCGSPLQRNCSDDNASKNGNQNRSEMDHSETMFFYFGFGPGFVVGLWAVFFTLMFKKTWRYAYFCLFDKTYDKVYVFVVMIRRRLGTDATADYVQQRSSRE